VGFPAGRAISAFVGLLAIFKGITLKRGRIGKGRGNRRGRKGKGGDGDRRWRTDLALPQILAWRPQCFS